MSALSTIEGLEPRRLLAFSPIQIGGSGYDSGYETIFDSHGNIIVAGIFHGKVDFDPTGGVKTLNSAGETDIYIAKYSPSGHLIWVGQIGGDAGEVKDPQLPIDPVRAGGFVNRVGIQIDRLGEYVSGITLDQNGNIFLTGSFFGTVDFNPTGGKFNIQAISKYNKVDDAFLVKLNGNGQFIWADAFGGEFNDVGNSVAVDPQGNAVVTGYFTRAADFDPTKKTFSVAALGRDDIFVAKYSGSNGHLVWVDTIGGDATTQAERDAGNGVAVDGKGNIFVTGTFAGNDVDFDPSPKSQYFLHAEKRTDVFLLELSPPGKRVFAESFGGKDYDGGVKVALHDGSIYTASYFQGEIDADPGAVTRTFTAAGSDDRTDLLISKFHGNGSLEWAKQISGEGFETIGGFGVAADGSVYTSGGFYDAVDFDPGPGKFVLTSTEGDDDFEDDNDGGRDFSYDIFVSRLSSAGKFLAATRIGSTSDDFGAGLALSADGSFLALTGQFKGTVAFDSTNDTFKRRALGKNDSFLIELSQGLKLLT